MSSSSPTIKVTLNTLAGLKEKGERFACVTAYDATFAEIASSAGIEVLLGRTGARPAAGAGG